jgi:hypothetical protein
MQLVWWCHHDPFSIRRQPVISVNFSYLPLGISLSHGPRVIYFYQTCFLSAHSRKLFVKQAFTIDFSNGDGLFANQGPIGVQEMVNLLKPSTDKDLER